MKSTNGKIMLAVFLCLVLGLTITFSMPALANTEGVIRNPNGGSYVNVRSWPSYDADIMTTLYVGTSVQITGTTGTWYSVWINGLVGYIHANFVSVQGGGSMPGSMATVRNGPLNVREAPSMRARVITQLPTGYRVNVTADEGTWSQIQAGTTIGYVVSNYLVFDGGNPMPAPKPPIYTENANATIRTSNGGNLNLRSYGSSSADIVDSYGNGSRVRVLTRGTSWCRVQAGSQYGYMSTQFLVFDGNIPGPVPNPSVPGYDAVVNNPGSGQVLNLRAEPSMGSRVLGQYHNGDYVKVVGVGTEWHRVSINGVEGYMMAKYVRITSSGATPNKTISGGANGFVNLRSGPGYNFGIIARMYNGDAATVTIPYPTWSEVLVRQGSGYTRGFILNTFLR